jgi:hypothetical protein
MDAIDRPRPAARRRLFLDVKEFRRLQQLLQCPVTMALQQVLDVLEQQQVLPMRRPTSSTSGVRCGSAGVGVSVTLEAWRVGG